MGEKIERKFFITGIAASGILVACSGSQAIPGPGSGTPKPTAAPSGKPTATPSGKPTATPSGKPTSTPTTQPTSPPNTMAVTIVNNNPRMTSSKIEFYIFGQNNATNAWEYVTANGGTVAIPNTGDAVVPIKWAGTGNTSQTLFVPPLTACRIYIVCGSFSSSPPFTVGKSGAGPNTPAPWAGTDGSQTVFFDYVEYTWNSGGINIDTTQVDCFGLALGATLKGASGTQKFGFLGGSITATYNGLKSLGGQWATLNKQYPYRVVNPKNGNGPVGFFTNDGFLDSDVMGAWNSYKSGVWLTMGDLAAAGSPNPVYGTVDADSNFNWYTTKSTSGTLIGTMPNPQSVSGTTPTIQMFSANGVFVNFTNTPAGNETLMAAVGNRVSGALNRGTMSNASQPACPPVKQYPGSPYQNQYASVVHSVAANPAYGIGGGAYAFPYDDNCNQSTDTTDAAPKSLTIRSVLRSGLSRRSKRLRGFTVPVARYC